ncbi:heterokaryon incompatibility protein-domain-containing protein [Tricladium varicosporioides]|nr:heterokaryon incompatibility protein-domain-containing protein [Hymenoscyphus varicosporioides]
MEEDEKTRVLILQPGKIEQDLEFDLVPIKDYKDFKYEALSYAWGDPTLTHPAYCSGMEKKITANLDAALRRLRHSHNARCLWVDAICVDQNNNDEKARQVNMMQEIYENAKQVIIWLGAPLAHDSLAFESLRRLQGSLEKPGNNWFSIALGWYRGQDEKFYAGGAHRWALTAEIEYEHLVNLLCRPWFTRTWVIQEVASAKNAIVLYGQRSMQWEAFADTYIKLGDHFLPVTQFRDQQPLHSLESIGAIEDARRAHSGPLTMSLFHILVATSYSQCNDPRDKVFAVQGLARDWIPHQSTPKLESVKALQQGTVMAVDYTLPVTEIFTQFAVSDSKLYRDLRSLSCAMGPNPTCHGLPSWVPDWTSIYNTYPFVRFSDRTQFSASGRMKAVAWHSHKQKFFHVTGKVVDKISVLGQIPDFAKAIGVFEITKEKLGELRKSLKWLQDCEMIALSTDPTQKQSGDLWRTMVCGLTGEGFPAPAKYAEYFSDYMRFLSGDNNSASAPDLFLDFLNDARGFAVGVRGTHEKLPKGHALIEASIYRWASRRRLCKTKNGRLGFAPKAAQEGDLICVLYGGEVPYVLRPWKHGYFLVIGECYLDGIMHGEGLSEDAPSKVFKLL